LHVPGLAAYRDHLDAHPGEWAVLGAICRITISRFYRDRAVFDHLRRVILPELARLAPGRGAAAPESVGTYSWGGFFYTYVWVDPANELIGILFTQTYPSGDLKLREDFKRLTYAALLDAR
jgi:CubicO group peptidase (beta-lactamase class C family)